MHSFTVLEKDLLVPICNTNKGKISDLNRHVRVLEETLKARVSFFYTSSLLFKLQKF